MNRRAICGSPRACPPSPTACRQMTITSASRPGRVDLEAFGLTAEDLVSLRALKGEWAHAAGDEDSSVPASADETRVLVDKLGDVDWQDRWLQHWRKLYGQGFPSSALAALMSGALDSCERVLFVGEQPVQRIHLELFALLRRAVMAVVSCAVDLGEEAHLVEAGVPGELSALRCVRDLAAGGGELAVLSVSVLNRDAFVHLAASDLQSLPAVISSRIQEQLRAQDCLFTG